jgi:hypothetical protein
VSGSVGACGATEEGGKRRVGVARVAAGHNEGAPEQRRGTENSETGRGLRRLRAPSFA